MTHATHALRTRIEPQGGSVQEQLGRFASRMLEECGGLVEWERPGEAGAAVLPPDVAHLLGVDEEAPLSSRQQTGGLCIGLASEFLDQADAILHKLVPRVGDFTIPDCYLKGGDLQKAVDREFTWHNARVRVADSGPQRVDYHTFWFFVSLKSEDVWESRVSATINSASLAPVALPEFLSLLELEPSLEPSDGGEAAFDAAVRAVREQVLHEAEAFLARMESRLERDRKRLRDYYGALKREAAATKRRSGPEPSAEDIAARKRAVNLELDRKLIELAERYEVAASLEPIARVCVQANVLAVELAVQRKRAQRTHVVYWNPLVKQFEPLCCTHCGRGVFSVAFSDEDVSPFCPGCRPTAAARKQASLQ